MKLHLGCGRHILDGYVNVDAQHERAQIKWDRLDNIPGVSPSSAEEILCVHVFEHLWPDEALPHLRYWHSILKPGGLLILEMPDLYKSAKNYIEMVDNGQGIFRRDCKQNNIDQMAMWPFYGDNHRKSVYDCHKWGWTFKTLQPLLSASGFSSIELDPQWHGRKKNRDFRVEAVKK